MEFPNELQSPYHAFWWRIWRGRYFRPAPVCNWVFLQGTWKGKNSSQRQFIIKSFCEWFAREHASESIWMGWLYILLHACLGTDTIKNMMIRPQFDRWALIPHHTSLQPAQHLHPAGPAVLAMVWSPLNPWNPLNPYNSNVFADSFSNY